MPDIQYLQRQREEKIGKMRAILKKSDDEKRELTAEEVTEFNSLDEEARKFNESIDIELRLKKTESETRKLGDINLDDNRGDDPGQEKSENRDTNDNESQNEFRNIGEFLWTVANRRNDERLSKYWHDDTSDARSEKRATAQKMGVGALGGFAIPDQFIADVLKVSPQEAVVRSRATVIPAGSPPDAKLKMPSLDQTATSNMYGGITLVHSGEDLERTLTNLKMLKVELEPKDISGALLASNKLLNNWEAGGSFFKTQMSMAKNGQEDYDFLRGTGANQSTGVLNAACRIDYSRATASTIVYADVVGMLARMKFGGSLIWLASQTTIPQLANIADAGSNNLWVQSATDGIPSTMLGYPVVWSDRLPALGTRGDLCLLDLKYYLVKDGSGPFIDMSTDYRFLNDETTFKLVWNVDGQAWLKEPLPLEGSTSNTVSPFVILK